MTIRFSSTRFNCNTKMTSNTTEGEVIHVSKKGLIYEEDGKIVVEPLPSVEEMQGVHAGRYEKGEVLKHLQEMQKEDRELERKRDERLEEH